MDTDWHRACARGVLLPCAQKLIHVGSSIRSNNNNGNSIVVRNWNFATFFSSQRHGILAMTSSKMSLATRLQDELGDSLVMETRFQESIIKARFSVSSCFVPAAAALCNPDLSEGTSFLCNPGLKSTTGAGPPVVRWTRATTL